MASGRNNASVRTECAGPGLSLLDMVMAIGPFLQPLERPGATSRTGSQIRDAASTRSNAFLVRDSAFRSFIDQCQKWWLRYNPVSSNTS